MPSNPPTPGSAMQDPAGSDENIAQTIRDIMLKLGEVEIAHLPTEDKPLAPTMLAIPEGRKLEDITPQITAAMERFQPLRRRGTARMQTLESLIDWANRFKGDTSALFANPDMTQPSLTCIANYHDGGGHTTDGREATARHCDHRGIYSFPLSKQWNAWRAVSVKPLDKDELGEFIEENAMDILDPTPAILSKRTSEDHESWENRMIDLAAQLQGRFGTLAQLLQMSKSFQIHQASNLSVSTNRDTGEASIQFTDEHNDAEGRPLQIPNLLMITIPVFESGAPYRMAVRFRYQKTGSQVKFRLQLHNVQRVFDACFDEAIQTAASATDLPLFLGTPEA